METTPRPVSRATVLLCLGETTAMVTPTVGGRLDAPSFVLRAGGHATRPPYERLMDPLGFSQDLPDGPSAEPGSQGA